MRTAEHRAPPVDRPCGRPPARFAYSVCALRLHRSRLAPVAEMVPVEEHLRALRARTPRASPRHLIRHEGRRRCRLTRGGMQMRPLPTRPPGREEDAMTGQSAAKVGLKQEKIAIVAVGLTLFGTILVTTSRLEARLEARIEHVETRIGSVQAEIRAEARADREASARDREAFFREILRLTSEQSRLAGVVEGPRAE